jgi:hypothetical protein
MLKYLPVLAVLGATIIGLLIGKDLYPTLPDSQSTTPTQVSAEPKDPQLLRILGAEGPCFSSAIYTSFPPKCKNAEGEFVLVPGTSSNVFPIPEGK